MNQLNDHCENQIRLLAEEIGAKSYEFGISGLQFVLSIELESGKKYTQCGPTFGGCLRILRNILIKS